MNEGIIANINEKVKENVLLNRMQGLYRYDVGVDANGYSPVSMEEILAWFEGVECRGRVKWKDWVDETGDKKVRRKLAGCKE